MSDEPRSRAKLRRRFEDYCEAADEPEECRRRILPTLDAVDWSREKFQDQVIGGDQPALHRLELAQVAGVVFGYDVQASILIELAEHRDCGLEFRVQALTTLSRVAAKMTSKAPLERLGPLCHSLEESSLRRAAVESLKFLDDEFMVPHLVYRLVDPDESAEVRAEAAEALGGGNVVAAAPLLRRSLSSRHRQLRFWATYSLGVLGVTEALADLCEMAEEADDTEVIDDFRTVREEARWAVKVICEQPRLHDAVDGEHEQALKNPVFESEKVVVTEPRRLSDGWTTLMRLDGEGDTAFQFAGVRGRTRAECMLLVVRILGSATVFRQRLPERERNSTIAAITELAVAGTATLPVDGA